MKPVQNTPSRRPPVSASGFTLVEMMIAVTVFTLIILSAVALQIFASRVYTLAATKLTATYNARKALNELRDQIRECKNVEVGNYTLSSGNPTNGFSTVSTGSQQQGNALLIYPTTNSDLFTIAFLQPADGSTNFSGNTNSLIVETFSNGVLETEDGVTLSNTAATYITNQLVFQAQDCFNNVLTNNVNERVIQITMFFSQWEYPIAMLGSNAFNAYDYYRLQTRVTRRAVD